MKTKWLVAGYVGACAGANLSAWVFGPWATPINAVVLVAASMYLRDRLHRTWAGDGVAGRMALMILAGALLSSLAAFGAWRVSLASFIAFTVSGGIDAVVFQRMIRSRHAPLASNAVSAPIDSVLFLSIAFGAINPVVALLQIAGKIGCAAIYAALLARQRQFASVPSGANLDTGKDHVTK